MKHVLFIPGWYWNLHGQGGGTFFREQAAVLRTWGWNVHLLYADLRPTYWPRARIRFDEDAGVPILRYQNWAPPKLGRWTIRYWQEVYLRAFTQYRSRWGVPDLIHAHSYLGALAAAAIYRSHGIPYVVTEHLSRMTRGPAALSQRIQRAIRMAYAEASALYAVSADLAEAMRKYTDRPIDGVIPNMVNTDFFAPTAEPIRPTDAWQLCSIGDPWRMKGLDLLIAAVGMAQQRTGRPIRLKLADKIPGRAQLLPIIDKWELRDRVEFLGWLPKAAVRDLLRKSHACVSASRYESFGITMIEALACGTPVIATRTAGGRQTVRDGENGYLVEIGSAEALATAIGRLIAEPQRFDSQQLRAPVVAQNSYLAVAARIEAAYHRVIDTTHAR